MFCCMQGLPEGCTAACYPIQPPGIAPYACLRDSDLDRREVGARLL